MFQDAISSGGGKSDQNGACSKNLAPAGRRDYPCSRR